MPKSSPILTAFTSGEFGPQLEGRVDLEDYAYACKYLQNFIPTIQGPAVRRAGTRYVNAVKNNANNTWFARFEFNIEQAYILEFGDQYIRFYLDNGQLQSGGSPYEIVSPYQSSDLEDADGFFQLVFVQSGDIVYFTHRSETFPVYKLSRLAATNWTMTAVEFEGGPFEDLDPDNTTTVYASAATGSSVTLTASGSIFASTDVGSLFLLENKLTETDTQWEPGKSISTNDIRKSDGKWYLALNTATTGTITPTHTSGAVYDGDTGVQWQYLHAGYGWVKITGFTSATVVTADVLSRLPDDVVGSGNATTRWAFGSWSATRGYPSHVLFFKERLTLINGKSQRVRMSVTSDYENFSDRNLSGEVVDDRAITVDIVGGQVNRIEWAISAEALLIGSAGGEHIVRELTSDRPLAPGNVTAVTVSEYGSSPCQPVRVGNSILFVQRSGRKIRELAFRPTGASVDGYASIDISVNAPHYFPRGTYITQMKFQQEPYSVVWILRNDGQLFGCRYNANTQSVGFFRSPIGGDAIVESIEVIPSPAIDRDELWLIARRTINSSTTRYVEWMEYEWDEEQPVEDRFYVDSGATYSGAATTTITGLGHLEGKTVDVLVDGAAHPQRTVSSGQITLARAGEKVQVGLPCPAKLQTMRINAGAADGTAQGKIGRINFLTIRFWQTLGGKTGPNEANLDLIQFRQSGDPMDAPPPTFSGDKSNIAFNSGYELDNYIWYVNDQPLPATITAMMPQIQKQDR